MTNLLLSIRFDGTDYHGWQVQINALSIQEVFQNALEKFYGERPDVKGCSRTDAGVHANEYCVSFMAPFFPGEYSLICALNRFLPDDIKVFRCKEVALDFHARYSCKAKEYIYRIDNGKFPNPFFSKYALHYRYPLDEDLLNRACKAFEGTHDFTSFCSVKSDVEDSVRTIYHCSFHKNGDECFVRICGDGFLYNMVRIIVGTLLYVASGKISCEDIPRVIESCDRTLAGKTAPAKGLFLNRVFYDEVR